MLKRKRRLLKLDVDEISLVDRPATSMEFLVVKNADGDDLVEVDSGEVVAEAVAEFEAEQGGRIVIEGGAEFDALAAEMAQALSTDREDDDVDTDLRKDVLPVLLPLLGKFFDERGRTCSKDQLAEFVADLARQSGDESEANLEALMNAVSREIVGWNAYMPSDRQWRVTGVTT